MITLLVSNSKYTVLFTQGYGYVLYRHELTEDVNVATLSVPGIRDRGYVVINNVSVVYYYDNVSVVYYYDLYFHRFVLLISPI